MEMSGIKLRDIHGVMVYDKLILEYKNAIYEFGIASKQRHLAYITDFADKTVKRVVSVDTGVLYVEVM